MEAPVQLAGAIRTGASRSVQGPPISASSAVPSQSIVTAPSDEVWRGSSVWDPRRIRRSVCIECLTFGSFARRLLIGRVRRTVYLASGARFPLLPIRRSAFVQFPAGLTRPFSSASGGRSPLAESHFAPLGIPRQSDSRNPQCCRQESRDIPSLCEVSHRVVHCTDRCQQ